NLLKRPTLNWFRIALNASSHHARWCNPLRQRMVLYLTPFNRFFLPEYKGRTEEAKAPSPE
ncbi:MAG TPA: hypothetical protein VK658_08040, partial [Chryseolinea sp.]|nr:hypothetical protein [Chryseolinea sp.]